MWETEDDGKITPVSAEQRPGGGTRGTERESVPHVTLAVTQVCSFFGIPNLGTPEVDENHHRL